MKKMFFLFRDPGVKSEELEQPEQSVPEEGVPSGPDAQEGE